MLKISNRGKGKCSKKAPAGSYDATVKKVGWVPGREDDLFEIVYDLVAADGKKYRHAEMFRNDERNTRTKGFFDYLDENGIDDLDDFVGKKEHLILGDCEAYDGNIYVNIVERKFL